MDKRFVAFLILAMSVAQGQTPGSTGKLTVTVGKSLIIDSSVNIHWVSVANGELFEAVAVNPREVLINGKSPGETSLVIEQVNGNRLVYDLTVRPAPPVEGQILLRVRFASVDRNAEADLGLDLVSADAAVTSPPVNTFLVRPDINLPATLRALEARDALEILAEPNIMAIDGKQASFVAGGEFPFPTLQGGAGVGAVTIQFREFGVRLNFLPNITPRGTLRLQVAPEVSSLDFAHAVTSQGFTIPTPITRGVLTEVELESGQSFAIGGLLDNRTSENLSKMPGLANIPLLRKLSQSKSNTEPLVIITPEIACPIAAGRPGPSSPRYPPPATRLPELDSPLPPSSPAVPFPGPSPSPERRG